MNQNRRFNRQHGKHQEFTGKKFKTYSYLWYSNMGKIPNYHDHEKSKHPFQKRPYFTRPSIFFCMIFPLKIPTLHGNFPLDPGTPPRGDGHLEDLAEGRGESVVKAKERGRRLTFRCSKAGIFTHGKQVVKPCSITVKTTKNLAAFCINDTNMCRSIWVGTRSKTQTSPNGLQSLIIL